MSRYFNRLISVSVLLSIYSCGSSPSVMVTPNANKTEIKYEEAVKNDIAKSIVPVAKPIPENKSLLGNTYKDNYSWLKNKNSPNVKKYLQEEATYSKIVLSPNEELQKSIYKEIFERTNVNDTTYPEKIGKNYYYFKKDVDQLNPIYIRKKNNLQAKEEVILDINNLFRESGNIRIGDVKVSPDQKYLAYTLDTDNSGNFKLYIKNIINGNPVDSEIINTSGNIEWTNDNKSIYYVLNDNNSRPEKVYKHNIGSGTLNTLIYSEKDKNFKVTVSKTDSDAFILIKSKSEDTSEVRYLGAKDSKSNFKVFQPRKTGIIYDLEHNSGKFFVLTNSNASNFKVISANIIEQYRKNSWKEIIPENSEHKIQSIKVFRDYVAALFEENGRSKIKVYNLKKNKTDEIDLKDTNYKITLLKNNDFNSSVLRFSYSSLLNPDSTFEYNTTTKKMTVLKKDYVRNYNPNDYQTERVLARSDYENKNIPIALISRKGNIKNGNSPLLMEISDNYSFSPDRISLLERGFTIALANVGDMNGNVIDKGFENSLISSAEYLINNQYTSPDKMSVYGKNNSGLVLAQALNKRPELFKTVLLDSPVLDLVENQSKLSHDMSSSNYFDVLMSNSPYDNIRVEKYPDILINAKNEDKLYEAIKYIAKLRASKKDNNKVVLKPIDKLYSNSEDNSVKYAFILNSLGLKN